MLSVPHLVIIFLVALIVFGPEKLPELARTFGKAMSEFKRATGDLRSGFEEHMRELEREASIREAQKSQAAAASEALPEASAEAPLVEAAIAHSPQAEQASVTVAEPLAQTVPEKARDGDA